MERRPSNGEIYRHFKGKLYQIIGIAKHSETKEELVIYQALYGDFSMYARPLEMFISPVDKEKYPNVGQQYRFEKVEKSQLAEGQDNSLKIQIEAEKEEKTACNSENEEEKVGFEQNRDKEQVKSDNMSQEQCNPYLLSFLEADTIKDKRNILMSIKNKIDDRLINDIAASLDITIDDGDIDTRFNSLLNCLNTMSKFECNRFR